MSTRTDKKTPIRKDRFVSPDDLLQAAKNEYFKGKSPVTERDWALVLNFVAANVSVAEESICLVFKKIYDIPLEDDYIKEIARFQASNKLDRRNGRRPNHK